MLLELLGVALLGVAAVSKAKEITSDYKEYRDSGGSASDFINDRADRVAETMQKKAHDAARNKNLSDDAREYWMNVEEKWNEARASRDRSYDDYDDE